MDYDILPDVNEWLPEELPTSGQMPDVAISGPPVSDIFSESDSLNGGVIEKRLAFGAKNDPNRAKVTEWVQVDDLGGITSLWAGTYNGTIYLHAGPDAPAAAEDDGSDESGAIVAAVGEQWDTGAPVMTFAPVPMDARLEMLQNDAGQWRRLIWEPLGLFDVFPDKRYWPDAGSYPNVERYTLWCIVDGQWVAFFTTHDYYGNGMFFDSAPARWPYTYWSAKQRQRSSEVYAAEEVDGGIDQATGIFGAINEDFGCRYAPLPWQFDDAAELEPESEFLSGEGVLEGQFYALPPSPICPRHITNFRDRNTWYALNQLYVQENGDYTHATKEQAYTSIVSNSVQIATEKHSNDPVFCEDALNPYYYFDEVPWFSPVNQFEVLFDWHIDGSETQWPHWLAVFSAISQTSVLSGSVCAAYNDFEVSDPGLPGGDAPGGFEPGEPDNPDDPDDPYTPTPDPPNPDDPEDETEPEDLLILPDGYYYEAGEGVSIKRAWAAGNEATNFLPGWQFFIHADSVPGTTTCSAFDIIIFCQTENMSGTYTFQGNQYNMYYGISQTEELGSTITVEMKSSYIDKNDLENKVGGFKLPNASMSTDYLVELDDLTVDSSTSPHFGGDVLSVVSTGSFYKRGTCRFRYVDYASGQVIISSAPRPYKRTFHKYRLTLLKNTLHKQARKNSVKLFDGLTSRQHQEVQAAVLDYTNSALATDNEVVPPIVTCLCNSLGVRVDYDARLDRVSMGDFTGTIIYEPAEEVKREVFFNMKNAHWRERNGAGYYASFKNEAAGVSRPYKFEITTEPKYVKI